MLYTQYTHILLHLCTVELQRTLFRVSLLVRFSLSVGFLLASFILLLSILVSVPFFRLHSFRCFRARTKSITDFHSANGWMLTPQVYMSFLGLSFSFIVINCIFYIFIYFRPVLSNETTENRSLAVLFFIAAVPLISKARRTQTQTHREMFVHMPYDTAAAIAQTERITNDFSIFRRINLTNLICLIAEEKNEEKKNRLPFQCLPFIILHWK